MVTLSRVVGVLHDNFDFMINDIVGKSRSSKRVLYYGWLGQLNFGDDALYVAIEDLVGNKVRLYGSDKANRLIVKKILEKYCFNSLMLGGGTFINRNDAVLEYLRLRKNRMNKMVVFGSGAVDKEFWEYAGDWQDRSEGWSEVLSDSKFVGVRGPASLRYLKSIGIDQARIVGDPVLHLGASKILKKNFTKSIGINFGFSRDRLWGKSDVAFAKRMIVLAKILDGKGWKVSFFSVWTKDTDFMRKCLKDFYPEYSLDIFNAWEYKIDGVLEYFNKQDLFLAEKLHAGIAAACAYTPFIMFEYQPKCRDFMESIDFMDLNIKTDAVDTDDVMNIIDDLYQRIPYYQEKLFNNVSLCKRELRIFADEVTDFICQH